MSDFVERIDFGDRSLLKSLDDVADYVKLNINVLEPILFQALSLEEMNIYLITIPLEKRGQTQFFITIIQLN